MEGENLVRDTARIGAYFKAQLIERLGDHPLMSEVGGDGLMLAIELVASKETKKNLISNGTVRIAYSTSALKRNFSRAATSVTTHRLSRRL